MGMGAVTGSNGVYGPYRFVHRDGCGETAFYYSHMPEAHEMILSSCATMPDGKKPIAHTKVRCGSCGEVIKEVGLLRNFIEPV